MKSREDFELKNYFESLSTEELVKWYNKQVRKSAIWMFLIALAYAIAGYVIGVGGI